MKWQVSPNFQIYLGKTDDRPPNLKVSDHHNSFTLYIALHAIQLYVLSFGVELLDRSVIYLFLQKISVSVQLLLCFWLHIVVVVVKDAQQQQEKINIKVFGKSYEKTYCEGNNFYCQM